ncbi:MutS domain V [Thermoanaerobacter thermohydrosulfuricus]|uniref:DNA mismatch repair protein MutS domain protein n=4 Tax=Thermoanaerobacter TaxID=1754 RepID=B0KBI4_THEP3|nr:MULTISPECIES: DNA mismatch repair protein MutS [Thermoanaerobacter]ABY93863.1 DNA mismatch repair protein MutS domain protein [Thermoanaerobacter pseudethanolicus ATCC 33223]ADV78824.1 DNA mismatch repair protein MutS domain protein [Thermoanaerobacter brockii subsp. finnii Ako-1]EMT39773.1 Mismatch repair ATPase (MutS family) [Thermoanaerobacter thermohydrosulfuricus WC1]SDF59320.1 MutS domain V [Thermoanaerobacter thermohydrosulfuricus]HBW59648.1 DNA mismatch repair protein MutS [Thermoan
MFNNEMVLEILYVILIGGGLILGFEVNTLFFLLLFVAIILIFIINNYKKTAKIKEIKEKIEEQWGKEHVEKRNFEFIKKLYDILLLDSRNSSNIDDITWRDLDMDFVFGKLDHTMSNPGQQYLYNLLRNPVYDKKELEGRSKIINNFMKNNDFAKRIQLYLHFLGKDPKEDVTEFLWNGIKITSNPVLLYKLLVFLLIISPLIIIFVNPGAGIFMLMLLLISNSMIYSSTKYKIYSEMMTFKYVLKLISCAKNIIKESDGNPEFDIERLKDLYNNTKIIRRNLNYLDYLSNSTGVADNLGITGFFSIIFLMEPIGFYEAANLINKHLKDLQELYIEIGKIDTYIALASYRASLKYCTEPQLTKSDVRFIKAEDIYHPLLKDPVPNSIEVRDRGILITGSNASGKSTFLKTIGINAIFAHTFYTVLAKSYSSNYFKILTSIGTLDNIIGGDSYFMVEAKSLKRIIDVIDDNVTVLCILDEIFRGTNTIERISAANEVLKYMIRRNCLVVAATHDIELTRLAADYYDNYHFEEEVNDKDIKFNYILKEGPSKSRNAIKILKLLGYPEEIYKNALDNTQKIL